MVTPGAGHPPSDATDLKHLLKHLVKGVICQHRTRKPV